MAKRKKLDKEVEYFEKFTLGKTPKPQKINKKQYNKDLNSYICRLSNQSSIFQSYIGEPVRVLYQAPTAKIKLIGGIGNITNIVSDTLGNRIYELAFQDADILKANNLTKLNLTFSEEEIEFVNPKKFKKMLKQFSKVSC